MPGSPEERVNGGAELGRVGLAGVPQEGLLLALQSVRQCTSMRHLSDDQSFRVLLLDLSVGKRLTVGSHFHLRGATK
jgi:hypothetical protein